MRNFTVRNVPRNVHRFLRSSAKRHKRRLNAELLAIIHERAEEIRRQRKGQRELARLLGRIPDLRLADGDIRQINQGLNSPVAEDASELRSQDR